MKLKSRQMMLLVYGGNMAGYGVSHTDCGARPPRFESWLYSVLGSDPERVT